MSRQIQLRRGNADENAKFTGADGEVTVDTTTKTLRVHDGETAGGVALARATDIVGDWVVKSQLPTAENNYTWYRKYKSGWVEMGGRINAKSGINNITLPIRMSNNDYAVNLTAMVASSTQRIVQQQEASSAQQLCIICNSDFMVCWTATGQTE